MNDPILPRLDGALCVVSGATSGVGYGAALGLARLGAGLVLPCRSLARGEAAAARIRRETGAAVWVRRCDLAELDAVRAFAAGYREEFRRADVLVNSAGALFPTRQLTVDGLEASLAVGYLGPFLLTRLLLPALQASARRPARIVNVSGEFHRKVRLDFDDLQLERGYSLVRAGARVVLAKLTFTAELARRLPPGITANALHPGAVRSRLLRNLPRGLRLLSAAIRPFMLSEEEGGRTAVFLAASPEVAGVSGGYFACCAPLAAAPDALDPERGRRLWAASERLVGLA